MPIEGLKDLPVLDPKPFGHLQELGTSAVLDAPQKFRGILHAWTRRALIHGVQHLISGANLLQVTACKQPSVCGRTGGSNTVGFAARMAANVNW
jgi:hypothetical protein